MAKKKNEPSKWQSKIVGHGKVAASQLLANPFNHRRHPEKQRQVVAASIEELGFIKSVIVNQLTGHIVDGHERVMQALGVGEETLVDVEYVELSPEDEKKALLILDASSELATVDASDLDSLVSDCAFDTDVLNDFAKEMLDSLGVGPEPEIHEDDVPETPVDPITKLGDLWILGDHRLLCGDSTKAEDVGRLMDGIPASLVVTDPPYGVSYADKNAFLNAVGKGNMVQTPIENDHLDKESTQKLWKDSFTHMGAAMRPGACVYCFMPQGGDQMMMMMMMIMMGAGIEPRHELIWVKNNHVLGRTDYAYKHEPIMYAWKSGGHKFYGDFQTSVLEFDRPNASKLHPTMKPVELIARLVQNSSAVGEVLYEPFCGSGTTLIAAEQLGRKCYGMEISPAYCDVIVKRWENLTGQKAVKQ